MIVHQYGNIPTVVVDIRDASKVLLFVPIVFVFPSASIQNHSYTGIPAPLS